MTVRFSTASGSFSPDETDLRAAIETAARRLPSPLADADASWRALADTGLFTLPFDEASGGMAQRLPAVMNVIEGLGQSCADSGLVFSACTHLCSLGLPLARFAGPDLRAELLPAVMDGSLIGAHAITEPDAGSAAFDMRTRAVRVPGGWRLDGEKCFISNSTRAGMIVVYARTDADAGPLSGFSALLVPAEAPGLTVGASTPKIGLASSGFGPLWFDGVFVPDSFVLGRPGMGYAILDFVMKREILLTFAGHLGQMQRRMDGLRDHVRNRRQGGQRIGGHQAVGHRVVEDFIRVETARMWLYRAGEAVERGHAATREIAVAKLLTSEANLELALDAVRLRGGAGYLAEAGHGAEVADALGGVIYSGSSEIQRNRIAATLGF